MNLLHDLIVNWNHVPFRGYMEGDRDRGRKGDPLPLPSPPLTFLLFLSHSSRISLSRHRVIGVSEGEGGEEGGEVDVVVRMWGVLRLWGDPAGRGTSRLTTSVIKMKVPGEVCEAGRNT